MKQIPKINLARVKEIFTKNLGLKIGSVFLAILCWFVALNVEDPLKDKVITEVPIEVVNGPYLESMGLSYQMQRGTVRVTVHGPRSILNNIDTEDILVLADMTQIVSLEADPVMVPLSASCPRYPELEVEAFSVTPASIAIQVESLISESFVLTASTGETKPSKEYEVGNMMTYPEQLMISGPESLVSKIDKVVAKVDVNGMAANGRFQGKIEIIDKNQDAFTEAQMKYIKLYGTDANGMVAVDVELWKLQTDIKIEVDYSGKPRGGFEVEKITTVPEVLTVVGTDEALEALKEDGNRIVIPSDEIDVEDQIDDMTVRVDINPYLPENIRLATDVSSSVIVNVTILPDGSKLFDVPVTNIEQRKLADNLVAVYGSSELEVRIKGNQQILRGLKEEEIKGYVELAGLSEGTHTVPVHIELPNGLELVDDIVIELEISKQETAVTADNANALQLFTGKAANK